MLSLCSVEIPGRSGDALFIGPFQIYDPFARLHKAEAISSHLLGGRPVYLQLLDFHLHPRGFSFQTHGLAPDQIPAIPCLEIPIEAGYVDDTPYNSEKQNNEHGPDRHGKTGKQPVGKGRPMGSAWGQLAPPWAVGSMRRTNSFSLLPMQNGKEPNQQYSARNVLQQSSKKQWASGHRGAGSDGMPRSAIERGAHQRERLKCGQGRGKGALHRLIAGLNRCIVSVI
jgi:hypothetical protein